jgi:hypothetical protein
MNKFPIIEFGKARHHYNGIGEDKARDQSA